MPFTHTNDPAMGNLGYARAKLDFYPTPPDVTQALIPFLRLHRGTGVAWEPCCGDGAISKVLFDNGYIVLSTDIKDYGYSMMEPCALNFLQTKATGSQIITNPPYDLAESFIRKAIDLTREVNGVVAMLLRHEYDCAAGRNDLFNTQPFARKVVLTFRPRWVANSTGAPRHNYAWFIWDHQWTGAPVLSYAKRP